MSRTVTGYLDGRPVYRDDGPAFGRVQGFGGTSAGYWTGTVVAVAQPAKRLPRQRLHRPRTLCGAPVYGQQCARTAGHGSEHRTQAGMDRRAAGMRSGT